MRRTVQGIVLREINYKEADKILTVLTREEGKLTLKARGCRRKNSRLLASSQLLVYSELAITQRGEFITLAEGDPLTQFRRLGEDIDKLALASYFAEVTEKTVQEGEVCPDILSLLLNCLYALDALDKPLEQVKAVFQLRLLTLTGLAPLLDTCVVCGNRGIHAPLPGGAGGGAVYRRGGGEEALFLFPDPRSVQAAGPGDGGVSHDPAGAGLSDAGLL